MSLLLDSSILISAEKGCFNLVAMIEEDPSNEAYIPCIVVSEILYGCERAADGRKKTARLAYVEKILALYPILAFGLEEARRHAALGAQLAGDGIGIGAHDLMIAATCLQHDLVLATLNKEEFSRVPNLRLAEVSRFVIS